MTAPLPPAPPIAAALPEEPQQFHDRRHHGFWAEAQRNANTVFLFFMNPLLDEETSRLSGTRLMAWIMVGFNCYDIVRSHAIAELKLTKVVDAIDIHTVGLFGLAVLTWFGKLGLTTAVDLVKAWKGREG